MKFNSFTEFPLALQKIEVGSCRKRCLIVGLAAKATQAIQIWIKGGVLGAKNQNTPAVVYP